MEIIDSHKITSSTLTSAQPVLDTASTKRSQSQKKQHFSTQNPLVRDIPIQAVVCFSHLRWNFVYQRPQHLLSRASQQWPVWFIEEPIWGTTLSLDIRPVTDQIQVVVPHLPEGIDHETAIRLQRQLVNQLLEQKGITDFMAWYYTPMAMLFTDHLQPRLTLYDCMDELSAFKGASPLLLQQEKNLLAQAQVVFTGGYSLYEAKQARHDQVFAFPSCIEYRHFAQARQGLPDPIDQQHLTGPRIGYSGVIDERLDLDLLRELVGELPDWQFIMLGPIVKIDPASLPHGPNLHYLGMKNYQELPAYFSNWDVAMLPFARNEATQYISPTKTPEYLAAGLPVISTPIRDVMRTYGGWDQVMIADSVSAVKSSVHQAVQLGKTADWVELDTFLRQQSWDSTWQQMQRILETQLTVVQ